MGIPRVTLLIDEPARSSRVQEAVYVIILGDLVSIYIIDVYVWSRNNSLFPGVEGNSA